MWGHRQRFMLDTLFWPEEEHRSALGEFAAVLADVRLRVVPVSGLERDPAQQHAVAEAAAAAGHGVAVRLRGAPLMSPADLLASLIRLCGRLGVDDPAMVDVVVDLGDVRGQDRMSEALGALDAVGDALPWRTLTLLAGAAPALIRVPAGRLERRPRWDLRVWRQVAEARRRAGRRVPDYGDYGVRAPGPLVYVPHPQAGTTPSLHYTGEEEFLVVAGQRASSPLPQMPQLCRQVVQSGEFRGEQFSAGDRMIGRCARGALTTRDGRPSNGSERQWARARTNQHLQLVTRRLPA